MRLFILLCMAAIGTGCLHSRSASRDTSATTSASTAAEPAPGIASGNPFAPKSIRIYPLTRIETDSKGRRVVCYVEFKDAWGDTTKSTGTLTVLLYRPVGGVEPGMERQERSWEIDLSDLEKNSLLFDPATRTYRLSLRDLPDWLTPEAPALLRVSIKGDGIVMSDDLRLNQ